MEDVDEWKNKHLLLDDILLQKINKIMLVDWLHDSFPSSIPDDVFILEKHDLNHLTFILKNNPFNIKFLDQLGLLQCYLDSAPEGSEDAHITGDCQWFLAPMLMSIPPYAQAFFQPLVEIILSSHQNCLS